MQNTITCESHNRVQQSSDTVRTSATDTNANANGNQKIITETSVQNLLTAKDKSFLHISTSKQ